MKDARGGHRPQGQRPERTAELIKRVYELDPMACPECGGQMKVVAFFRTAASGRDRKDPAALRTLARSGRQTAPGRWRRSACR